MDFGVISEQFDSLIVSVGNKIDREFPRARSKNSGTRALVLGIYQGARNTFGATRFLLADSPPNAARKPEYALAVSPLCRAQVDAVCAIVFLFGDLERRTNLFYRSGWRELVEETDRVRSKYGSNPDWADWLAGRKNVIDEIRALAGITSAEAKRPSLVHRWPIPSHMLKQTKDASRKEFLEHLYDWYYRTFSQDAHFAWGGIARSLPILAPRTDKAKRARNLVIVRTRQVSLSIVLMMILVTELELELKFDLQDRIKYVWTVLREWADEASEVYDRFYQPVLGSASAALLK